METKYETIERELTDEEFIVIAKKAEDKNITLNELFNELLRKHIESIETKGEENV